LRFKIFGFKNFSILTFLKLK
jgi:hypothetical protein